MFNFDAESCQNAHTCLSLRSSGIYEGMHRAYMSHIFLSCNTQRFTFLSQVLALVQSPLKLLQQLLLYAPDQLGKQLGCNSFKQKKKKKRKEKLLLHHFAPCWKGRQGTTCLGTATSFLTPYSHTRTGVYSKKTPGPRERQPGRWYFLFFFFFSMWNTSTADMRKTNCKWPGGPQSFLSQ